MKGAWYLGSFSEIKLYIHWTFLILLGWIVITYYKLHNSIDEAMIGGIFIIILFGCVVLHEFGHALMAKRFHIKTKSITLLPIGGLASMEKMPNKPVQELWVALAGPLVNFIIAILLYVYLHYTGGMPTLAEMQNMQGLSADTLVLNLFFANLILGVFNLIPAFPMDGGRVLRAILAMNQDKSKATATAAAIGKFLAVLFIFFGIFYDFWLVFIGVFIYLGAGAENVQQSTQSLLKGLTVSNALIKNFSTLYPADTLIKASEMLLNSQDSEFLVLDINGKQAVGVLTKENKIRGFSASGPDTQVSDVMERNLYELTEEMPLEEVYRKMIIGRYRVCPVYRNEELIGIIDQDNIQELITLQSAVKKRASSPSMA